MPESDAAKESRSPSPVAADVPAGDTATVEPGTSSPSAEAKTDDEGSNARSPGEVAESKQESDAPPLPSGEEAPPLPNEPVPQAADDGWDCQFDPNTQAWFFFNRFTGKTQWNNPRVAVEPAAAAVAPAADQGPRPPVDEKPAAGGYNPAIHGDYDPNAWYAKGNEEEEEEGAPIATGGDPADPYGATATFNRFTGEFQTADMGPNRHSDEAKSRRQMNAFFDVDAAANAHDGRSLKAERSSKKPSKAELKAFKEKRRARKEEKRRAWLRD